MMLLTKVARLFSKCGRRGEFPKDDVFSANRGYALCSRPGERCGTRGHALSRDRVGEFVAQKDRDGRGDLLSQAEAGDDLTPSVLLRAGLHGAPFETAP